MRAHPSVYIAVVVIIGLLLLRSARAVPAGYVGVVDLFGRVNSEPLPAGMQLGR